MNIVKATRRYEAWLGDNIKLDQGDLRLKHKLMGESLFSFFRATFYRWMQIWPRVCSELDAAPRVLAIGDLHVENFGTWRDLEGRLIWGVNDFDETAMLPYTLDLVRLAASAVVAAREGHLTLGMKDVCATLISQYRASLQSGGRPFVLAEQNKWLRDIATNELRDPEHFWQKMDQLKTVRGAISVGADKALRVLMPERNIKCRVAKRIAGLGSLGHLRYVAIASWQGGRIARETRSLSPSAVYWAAGKKTPRRLSYQTVIERAVRCTDPFVRIHKRWLVRRLAPYCSRIELAALPRERDELRLLSAMAYETGNIHLGSMEARKFILGHLADAKPDWLLKGSEAMLKVLGDDWREWKRAA